MVELQEVVDFRVTKVKWLVLKNGSPVGYVWQGDVCWFGTDFWNYNAPYNFAKTQDAVIAQIITNGGY